MGPADIVAIVVIVLVIGAASAYIIKAKKSGKKCIGCPDSCSCNAKKKQNGGEGTCGACCHCHTEEK